MGILTIYGRRAVPPMRSKEPTVHAGAASGTPGHPPGSRPSRLSDASKQLSILLQDVDLDGEPALAEAVVEAVSAVARASGHVQREGERRRAEEAERSSRARRVENDGGDRPTARGRIDRSGSTVEPGGSAFVPEAGVE